MDDFHNPLAVRRRGADEIEAYYNNAFDYEKLIHDVLKPYQENGWIERDVLCLNLDTDRYETTRHFTLDENTIVLVEGVLLFRPPMLAYLDGKVFLEIDFDEALKRARERDIPRYGEEFLERYRRKYIPVQKRYIKEYSPQTQCDILIDNNNYLHPVFKTS